MKDKFIITQANIAMLLAISIIISALYFKSRGFVIPDYTISSMLTLIIVSVWVDILERKYIYGMGEKP